VTEHLTNGVPFQSILLQKVSEFVYYIAALNFCFGKISDINLFLVGQFKPWFKL